MTHDVPADAVTQDKSLEKRADASSMELCRHRWHWTHDINNPKRVSIAEYARQVGKGQSTIRMQVRGYEMWLKNAGDMPIAECIDRSNMSVERQQVVDAVAKAFGRSFGGARQTEMVAVSEIVTAAREKVVSQGVTFESAVEEIVAIKKAYRDRKEQDDRQKLDAHGLRFLEIENELVRAHNAIHKALVAANKTEWSDREKEMLITSLARISSISQLLDYAVSGTVDVDWDKEMEKLSRGVA